MAVSLCAINRSRDLDKSSTLFHLICALSKRGLQVLLVGTEPHCWLWERHPIAAAGENPTDAPSACERPGNPSAAPAREIAHLTDIPGLSMICGAAPVNACDSNACASVTTHVAPSDADFQRLADAAHVIVIENPAQAQLCSWSFLAPSDYMLCLADNLDSPSCLSVKMAVSAALRDLRNSLRSDGTTQHPCRDMRQVLANLWSVLDGLAPVPEGCVPDLSDEVPVEVAGRGLALPRLIPLTALFPRRMSRRAA